MLRITRGFTPSPASGLFDILLSELRAWDLLGTRFLGGMRSGFFLVVAFRWLVAGLHGSLFGLAAVVEECGLLLEGERLVIVGAPGSILEDGQRFDDELFTDASQNIVAVCKV